MAYEVSALHSSATQAAGLNKRIADVEARIKVLETANTAHMHNILSATNRLDGVEDRLKVLDSIARPSFITTAVSNFGDTLSVTFPDGVFTVEPEPKFKKDDRVRHAVTGSIYYIRNIDPNIKTARWWWVAADPTVMAQERFLESDLTLVPEIPTFKRGARVRLREGSLFCYIVTDMPRPRPQGLCWGIALHPDRDPTEWVAESELVLAPPLGYLVHKGESVNSWVVSQADWHKLFTTHNDPDQTEAQEYIAWHRARQAQKKS